LQTGNITVHKFGLIFDVDGVIADSERVNAEASIAVFDDMFGIHGVQRKDFELGLGRGAQEYMRAAARVHGRELTDAEAEAAASQRQANFFAILEREPLPAFPGILELMHAGMEASDWAVAIATSSVREKSQAVLTSAQVPYDQLVYVTGSDVTRKKPDPELFLTAAARLSLPTSHCVVLEDAPDGVAAAKAAGCHCIAITNSTTADKLQHADRIISSVAELGLADLLELVRA
jgi:beta-phosphoglucomutase